MSIQMTDSIIHFLARKETPEDVQKLKKWLAADPANRAELKQWLAAWDVAGMIGVAGKINSQDAYQRFLFRLNKDTAGFDAITPGLSVIPVTPVTAPSRAGKVMRTSLRIAAAAVVGFVVGLWCHAYLAEKKCEPVAFIENIVPLGSKSEIKLPDGSFVWLNAGSTLRYATNYGRTTRDVYLEGEGYFKVAKQPEKLFTVHTALSNITALGTEFNVKAYPGEDVVETTLIEGEVTVKQGETGQPLLLKPGQKLLISAQKETVTNEPEETQPGKNPVVPAPVQQDRPLLSKPVIRQLSQHLAEAEVSWKERNWRIESEPLIRLAVKIERRYDVVVRVDEKLNSYRFSGTIKDESLEQVLYAMQLTSPILFKVEGKNVFITVDPEKMKSNN